MVNAMLFGKGYQGELVKALDWSKQIIYRADGLCNRSGNSPYVNFIPLNRTTDGIVIAYYDEEPSHEDVSAALAQARAKFPWKFK